MDRLPSPAELEAEARRRLDPAIYDFIAGGADDELTLRANRAAFGRITLLPRVLRGSRTRDLHVELLGRRAELPVFVSPTAFHRLVHPEGELATARAAAKAGAIMIASMAATVPVEEIVQAGETVWFQVYIQPDRGFTADLVRRAEAAGCAAVVVSVDSPVFGHRERDARNGFHDLPAGLATANMGGRPIEFVPDLSWRDIGRLRGETSLPVVLKGVLHPQDAALAAAEGADAVIVSNHGGRQLDTVPASIEALPQVVEAVAARIPVLVDGGVRRGTDVVKALALGAAAAGVGRPVMWGLACGGEHGVGQVLERFRTEVDRALALCCCASPADVPRDLVRLPC